MTVYEKNIQYLGECYEELAKNLLTSSENIECVNILQSVNQETIVSVCYRDGKEYFLNSRYDDRAMVDTWFENQEKIKYQEVLVVFGLSNFAGVKKLLENVSDNNLVLLYEPDKNIFCEIIKYIDISDVIINKNSILCIEGLNDRNLEIFAQTAITYERINKIRYFYMWNYEKLYRDSKKKVISKFMEKIEYRYIERNTLFCFSKRLVQNKCKSCFDAINQYSVNQLIKVLNPKIREKNFPAIIVSAGPSLDKNVDLLRGVQDKAFIIAVDTSVKTLLNREIRPHVVVSVDSAKDLILFEHPEFSQVPMILCDQSNIDICKVHSGKRFYFKTNDSYMADLYKEYTSEEMIMLESGGSVANDAFSFAIMAGFKNIIMIGQDLAYPNNQRHAMDAYGKGEKMEDGKEYYEVEDIYGGKVLTEKNMDTYRIWFENKIMLYDFINVIDATEGGAKIHGAKIMTLSDTIRDYCVEKNDFYTMISEIEPCYRDDVKEDLLKHLLDIPLQLEELKEILKNGIRNYDKLSELARKGKNHTKEYSDLVGKIGELLKFIDENSIMGIISLYGKKEQYEVKDEIYNEKEDRDENIRDVISQGTKLLYIYIKSIDSFKEDYQEILDRIN